MQRAHIRQRVRGVVRTISAPPNSLYERNARNVMVDGMGVGLVSGVATFLPVFLARLGASNVLVGLLTAMPALTGVLLSIPLGQFLGRQRNIIRWYARSRLWVLSSYALTGLVPFVFGGSAPIAIITIWAIATIPQTVLNITFTLVMGAVAGPNKRMELMSRRWTTLGVSSAISVTIVGWTLEQIRFPSNYQWVFICSFVGGLISYYFSTSIALPEGAAEPAEPEAWRRSVRNMIAVLRKRSSFTRFIWSQLVFRCGMAMAIPLFPLYWVRVVQASDTSIGLINTVQSSVLLVAFGFWAYVARRRSAGTVLTLCALGLACYPLMTALSSQVWALLFFAGIAGIFVAGTDLVIFDVLMDTVPVTGRGTAIGLYHTTNYIATFAAPLLGTFLSNYVGIGTMLVVAAIIRVIGGLLFLAFRVGRKDAPTDAYTQEDV